MPMTNDDFFSLVGAVFQKCLETLDQKGHDYATENNRLSNFEADAKECDIPVWKALYVFAQKHEKAIKTFRETGKVASEPPEMRYIDRINYLLLDLACVIAEGYDPSEYWLRDALGMTSKLEFIPEGSGAGLVRSVQLPAEWACCGPEGCTCENQHD